MAKSSKSSHAATDQMTQLTCSIFTPEGDYRPPQRLSFLGTMGRSGPGPTTTLFATSLAGRTHVHLRAEISCSGCSIHVNIIVLLRRTGIDVRPGAPNRRRGSLRGPLTQTQGSDHDA